MIINLVNLVYLLFFDSFLNISSLEYLMARFMSFSLICLSIYSNFNYYKKNFQSMIVRVISLVVVVSLILIPIFYLEDMKVLFGIQICLYLLLY